METTLKEIVRMKVGAMDAGEFERMTSDLLPCIHPDLENFEPSFNHIGKTTKGKCDAYIYHAKNDTYTVVFCTTKQDYNKTKILNEINKNIPATKFFKKIIRVIICVNTPIRDEIEEYREACRILNLEIEVLSLEKITKHILKTPTILSEYFNEKAHTEEEPLKSYRRFDCGERLKEVRKDIGLSESQIIESIDFPSEKEWKSIEMSTLEVSEQYIEKISYFTGASNIWLKHGTSKKYPTITINTYDASKLWEMDKLEPIYSYMLIEIESMQTVLVVQYSEFCWQVFIFGFAIDFWRWNGDSHYIPEIFELFLTVNKNLKPFSRVISNELLKEFIEGKVHPSVSFKKAGTNNFWFEDMFDLYQRHAIADQYKHYGEWFTKLQREFKHRIDEPTIHKLQTQHVGCT